MNIELRRLLEEDQRDLKNTPVNRVKRDMLRRNRVRGILSEGGMTEGIDFFHAALIFQHGDSLNDWFQAHELAKKASELGYFEARWLAAVALDRWLVWQGRLAKYGNQLIPFGGTYRLPCVDPATTDEERKKWGIATLADLLAFHGLRGFAPIEKENIVSATVEGFQINVVRLTRHLVHSPNLEGVHCGFDDENRTILENSYGWRWVIDNMGDFVACWLSMPYAPKIAHIITGEESPTLEISEYQNLPAIWVKCNDLLTLYFLKQEEIWAVSGRDRNDIVKISGKVGVHTGT